MKLIFATKNKHKLNEIKAMLRENIQILSLSEIGFIDDIPETEPTIEGNALLKVRYIHKQYGIPCFADDTGLEVEALNNAPGVYSARYAGIEGKIEEKAKANMNKLLRELEGKTNRNARFRTVIAYIDAKNRETLFEGIITGNIIEEAVGNEGFGYDPIFLPDGYNLTFAQMPLNKKNLISHRSIAFKKFVKALMMSEIEEA